MKKEPGSPQIEEGPDDPSSDELYRPEGQPHRTSSILRANTTPQMSFAHHEKVNQKDFSQIELVQQHAGLPRFSVESLPDLPVKKCDCGRCLLKFLSIILFLSCIAEGVFLMLSMQKENDLRHELDMKDAKYNQFESDLKICKQKLKAKDDVDQLQEMQRIRAEFSEVWEALLKQEQRAKEQEERAGEHSVQIQSFREKEAERKESIDFLTARSRSRTQSVLPKEENSSLKNNEATLRFREAAKKVIENLKENKEKEKAVLPSEDRSGVKVVNVNGNNIPNLNLPAANDFQNPSPKKVKPAHWEITGHHWEKKSDEESGNS